MAHRGDPGVAGQEAATRSAPLLWARTRDTTSAGTPRASSDAVAGR